MISAVRPIPADCRPASLFTEVTGGKTADRLHGQRNFAGTIRRRLAEGVRASVDGFFWIVLLLAAGAFFALVFARAGVSGPAAYPYEKVERLFTPAERSFLGALEQATEHRWRVMGKVRLADVLHPQKGLSRSAYFQALNRIAQKHIDFVLCDPQTLRVVGVIELDDRSHERADRQRRDDLVDGALAAADIPILRVPVQSGYKVADLRQKVAQAFPFTVSKVIGESLEDLGQPLPPTSGPRPNSGGTPDRGRRDIP